jgi:processive rubber oxygenase RoxA-like protein
MNLSPKTRRLLWVSLFVFLIVLALGGWFTYVKFFREEVEVFASDEEHFKYGSLGAEGDRGIPYYLWLVLPRVFPDLMPAPGGYKSFGVVWEEGREIPIGFAKKTVGFARVTNNCAICHTTTYRLNEEEAPRVVVAGGGQATNLQSMLRFLFKAAHDPRFNSDIIMNEIRLVNANNYGNGGLSFIDRQIYRYVLIPFTKKALLKQEKQFTWMERFIEDGKPKPPWGPGRDDAMNLTKYFMTSMKEDNSVGPTDFPSIWNLGIRSGKDNAGKQMLLNWTGDTPAVRSVLIDSALGLGAPPRPWFLKRMADLDRYLSNLRPPPWPFAQTNPIDQEKAHDGQKIYLRDCASCHEPRGERTNKVIPIAEIGTDPERMHSWAKVAAEEANRRVKELGIDRPPMTELDPYGYLSPPLDGIWLRAPYLHNGSVPTLRDLLNGPNERPEIFHRGYDVFDPVKVGFKEPLPRPTGPTGELHDPHFLYDTRQRGNGNGGHTYGTQLPNDEKEKLLEYLKTI